MPDDRYYKWWDCAFDACEETHCSYHCSCPEHPPDVEFPYDDYPESRRTPRSRTPLLGVLKNQPNIWGDFTEGRLAARGMSPRSLCAPTDGSDASPRGRPIPPRSRCGSVSVDVAPSVSPLVW